MLTTGALRIFALLIDCAWFQMSRRFRQPIWEVFGGVAEDFVNSEAPEDELDEKDPKHTNIASNKNVQKNH